MHQKVQCALSAGTTVHRVSVVDHQPCRPLMKLQCIGAVSVCVCVCVTLCPFKGILVHVWKRWMEVEIWALLLYKTLKTVSKV